jgi:uncharacterized phiE125 gp8 family phage protein
MFLRREPLLLAPVRIVAPASPIVSLAEAKAHLRVDGTGDDARISAALDAAESWLDGWSGVLGRCCVSQTWRIVLPRLYGTVRLPFPQASDAEVTWIDTEGADRTVDPADYAIFADARGSFLEPVGAAQWPTSLADRRDAVRVTAVYGYGDPGDVPEAIRTAVKFRAQALFEMMRANPALKVDQVDGVGRREWDTSGSLIRSLETASDALISPFRSRSL